jgi:FtsP/CotA-like multicopper oxidase with cupredoxin domain
MNPRDPRLLLIAGGVIAAIVLFLVLRPSDDEDAATTDTVAASTGTQGETTTAAETETTTDTTPAATTTVAEPAPTIAVTVRDGEPVGGLARATVKQGDPVTIVVDADTADEVHVHGYDLKANVAPGKPARVAFSATLAGGFEIELEEAGLHIAELAVQP